MLPLYATIQDALMKEDNEFWISTPHSLLVDHPATFTTVTENLNHSNKSQAKNMSLFQSDFLILYANFNSENNPCWVPSPSASHPWRPSHPHQITEDSMSSRLTRWSRDVPETPWNHSQNSPVCLCCVIVKSAYFSKDRIHSFLQIVRDPLFYIPVTKKHKVVQLSIFGYY